MKLKVGVSLLAALLAVAAFARLDDYTFKSTPKVGDVHKYRDVLKFDVAGTDYDYSDITIRKVVRVDANGGFAVKEELSDVKVNDMPPPDGVGRSDTTTTFSANGEILKIEGDRVDENSYRFGNLLTFYFPDKSLHDGDTWSFDIKANKDTGAVAAKADYTLVGLDKVGQTDAYKVKFSVKESNGVGASSDGTVWFSKSDLTMLKLTGNLTNAPVPGATISGELTVMLVQ